MGIWEGLLPYHAHLGNLRRYFDSVTKQQIIANSLVLLDYTDYKLTRCTRSKLLELYAYCCGLSTCHFNQFVPRSTRQQRKVPHITLVWLVKYLSVRPNLQPAAYLTSIMSISPCQKQTLSAISPPPLLALPLELQYLVISHLSYPDALALKHTHPHFYNLVKTSVRLKVAWLLERRRRNLQWPLRCAMKTDAAFCGGNGEVRAIMVRRRAHVECARGEGGCEVVVGSTCGGGAKAMLRRRAMQRSWGSGVGRPGLLLIVWVVGLLVTGFVGNVVFVLRWRFSQR